MRGGAGPVRAEAVAAASDGAWTAAALGALPRAELQRLSKERGLRANGKSAALVAALLASAAAAATATAAVAPEAPVGAAEAAARPRCLVHGAPAAGSAAGHESLALVGGQLRLAGLPFMLAGQVQPLPADMAGFIDNLLCAACVAANTAAVAAAAAAAAAAVPAAAADRPPTRGRGAASGRGKNRLPDVTPALAGSAAAAAGPASSAGGSGRGAREDPAIVSRIAAILSIGCATLAGVAGLFPRQLIFSFFI
jgi:hypothetical protein